MEPVRRPAPFGKRLAPQGVGIVHPLFRQIGGGCGTAPVTGLNPAGTGNGVVIDTAPPPPRLDDATLGVMIQEPLVPQAIAGFITGIACVNTDAAGVGSPHGFENRSARKGNRSMRSVSAILERASSKAAVAPC